LEGQITDWIVVLLSWTVDLAIPLDIV